MVVLCTLISRSSTRRRSPSVNTPSMRPPSTTTHMPRPFFDITTRPSASDADGPMTGRSSPVRITSATCSSSLRPSAPPGCERAKSCEVKPRASSSATASASPSASVAVVLAVGARLSGQASSATLTSRWTLAARARFDFALPVMAMMGTPRRERCGISSRTSAVSPELEIASSTSSRVIMPMSPWLASAACMKNDGVPVEASVAAILPAMWPDLPMPVTMTRPWHSRQMAAGAREPRVEPRHQRRDARGPRSREPGVRRRSARPDRP